MATRYKQIDYTLKDFTDKFVFLETQLSNGSHSIDFWIKRAKNGEALYNEVMKYTKSGEYSQAIYNYRNECEDNRCKECNNLTSFKSFTKGYSPFCSFRCGTINEETQAKKANTCDKVYGDKIPMKNQAVKDKHKQSMANSSISKEETVQKRQDTYFAKTGYRVPQQNPEVREKTIQTNLKTHGVEHVLQLDSIKTQGRETSLLKYGVEHYAQSEESKQRLHDTCMAKYNVPHFTQTEEYKAKAKLLNREKYGCDSYFETKEFKDKLRAFRFANTIECFDNTNPSKEIIKHAERKNVAIIKCNDCELEYEAYVTTSLNAVSNSNNYNCPNCEPKNTVETQLKNYIIELGLPTPFSNRQVISPKEIDVYLSDLKIGIEYDGLMYHSEGISEYSKFNRPVENKNVHRSKTELCEAQGIRLFHIFENEWLSPTSKDIWKSMITNFTHKNPNRVFARTTSIKEISSKEGNQFFEENHIQGKCGAKVYIGLYHNNVLISCMSLGAPRYNKEVEWELIRFANKKYTSVIGGASKLLKYFETKYNPTSMISYANRRWSNGALYEKLGFDFIRDSEPNYFYFKFRSLVLESRQKFQKHKLAEVLENYDETLSETQNMFANGYRRIFDCGNKVYIKKYRVSK